MCYSVVITCSALMAVNVVLRVETVGSTSTSKMHQISTLVQMSESKIVVSRIKILHNINSTSCFLFVISYALPAILVN